MKTFVDHLTAELDNIKHLMSELLANSRIKIRRNDPNSSIAIIAPRHYWDRATDVEQKLQIKLKKSYGKGLKLLNCLPKIRRKVQNEKLMRLTNL